MIVSSFFLSALTVGHSCNGKVDMRHQTVSQHSSVCPHYRSLGYTWPCYFSQIVQVEWLYSIREHLLGLPLSVGKVYLEVAQYTAIIGWSGLTESSTLYQGKGLAAISFIKPNILWEITCTGLLHIFAQVIAYEARRFAGRYYCIAQSPAGRDVGGWGWGPTGSCALLGKKNSYYREFDVREKKIRKYSFSFRISPVITYNKCTLNNNSNSARVLIALPLTSLSYPKVNVRPGAREDDRGGLRWG